MTPHAHTQARRAELESMLLDQRKTEYFDFLSFAVYLEAKADDPDGRSYDEAVELLHIYEGMP